MFPDKTIYFELFTRLKYTQIVFILNFTILHSTRFKKYSSFIKNSHFEVTFPKIYKIIKTIEIRTRTAKQIKMNRV